EEMTPEEMEDLLAEQSRIQDKIDAANLWELDRTVELAMDAMRLPPGDFVVKNLSGGEKRRVALCKLLLQNHDILLLDEPTNHLDAESVGWLEQFLKNFPGTVVAVTHDRYFLDNVAGWILELDRGQGIPYEGNYSGWLEQKRARLAVEEKQESKRQKFLKRELEWVRMSPKAQATKNKARMEKYEQLAAQQFEDVGDVAEIKIPPGPPLGELVIEANNLTKAFGDKLLFDNLSFRLPRGGIVGVIGPNGAGKTTLFRMLLGMEQPDGGTMRIGDTVVPSYVDQSRDALDPKKTVFEEITGGTDWIEVGKVRMHGRAYVGRFNFKGTDQQKLVGQLSGGERNRVHLAKVLKSGGNLLML
ncbi:MAG: ATP-binding cassette domain-containing protein, partial [Planctomycetaceae bacterium]|nr:ATP-binding cassette domain-containing protein [Planctomycetaceae bacterium]